MDTTNQVNKERLLLWVEALEDSTRYPKQTTHMLCDDTGDGFCCLGVATDLYIQLTGKGYWSPENVDRFAGDGMPFYSTALEDDGEDPQYSVLPPEVAHWFGMGDEFDPELTGIARKDDTMHTIGGKETVIKAGELATMHASMWNDKQGLTFREIATMVRLKYGLPPFEPKEPANG